MRLSLEKSSQIGAIYPSIYFLLLENLPGFLLSIKG